MFTFGGYNKKEKTT